MNYLILIALLIMPICNAMHDEMEDYFQRTDKVRLEHLEEQVMMLTSENKTLKGHLRVAEIVKKHSKRPAETQTDAIECSDGNLLKRIKELETANMVLYSRNKMLESNLKYFLIGKQSNQNEETQTEE